jgi:hypothetical protein
MRARLVIALGAVLTLGVGCAGPYSAAPEPVRLPKEKKAKPKPGQQAQIVGALGDPNVCKVDFEARPVPLEKRNVRQAKQLAQDGENALSGYEQAPAEVRRNMVLKSLGYIGDALAFDPYSPQATYAMAVTYASAGKKKCAIELLGRLGTLGTIPDPTLQAEVKKYKDMAKKARPFEPFRGEADAALGG